MFQLGSMSVFDVDIGEAVDAKDKKGEGKGMNTARSSCCHLKEKTENYPPHIPFLYKL